jgi:hypothetical protein
VLPYQNGALFQNLIWGVGDLEMSVWAEEKSYLIVFVDRNDREGAKGQAKAMLHKMGCLDEYFSKDGGFRKMFAFPSQGEDLITHISDFKKKLAEVVSTK